jgi:D,D-heptose 1,7-bisphosphate phosphatase
MGATVTQCVVRPGELVPGDGAMGVGAVGGRSWLGWLMREFIRYGVTDFVLLSDAVPAELQASLPAQVRIVRSAPPAGSGSGGALFHVRDQLQDRFLWYDGSALFDWNLADLLADQAAAVGRIARFDVGTIGLFRRGLVDHLRPAGDLEADVLPDLVRRGLVRVMPAQGRDAGPGSPDAHRVGGRDIVARLRRRAVFLDRDGVLNVDHGYVGSRERFEWMDGALDAIRYATRAGWHVFVVTNQSGVARGLYTEGDVRDLLDWMADQVRGHGGTIDDVRFCPFHPEAALEAYRQPHPWRKPSPGMLLDLIQAWELDPERAVMVGDQATDMAAAAAAGVAGHRFRGGNLFGFLRPILDREV